MKNKCFYINTGCRADDDCPRGLSCFNKRCIRTKCRNDEMCNKLGGKNKFTCVSGKCVKIETCASNQQCKDKYGSKYACVKNICRKIASGCMNNDEFCPKGKTYYKDRCIQRKKCRRRLDCP